jgi:hypothetical protein
MESIVNYVWGCLPVIIIGTAILLFAIALGAVGVFLIKRFSSGTSRKRWAGKTLSALNLNLSTFMVRFVALLIVSLIIWAFTGFPDFPIPWKVAANG